MGKSLTETGNARACSARPPEFPIVLALLWGLLFTAGATCASADVLLRYAHKEGEIAQILVKHPYARMDLHVRSAAQRGFLLFNGADGSLYLVDDSANTYRYLDERLITEQIATLDALHESLRLQLGQLPSALQQEMELQLEASFRHRPQLIRTRATPEQRELIGTTCLVTEVIRADRVQTRVCVASPGDLGITGADNETFNDLLQRLFHLAQLALEAGGPIARALGQQPILPRLGGIPLEVQDAGHSVTTRLVGFAVEPLNPDFFRIPRNYREAGTR